MGDMTLQSGANMYSNHVKMSLMPSCQRTCITKVKVMSYTVLLHLFSQKLEGLDVVYHIDRDKTNSKLENLRLVILF